MLIIVTNNSTSVDAQKSSRRNQRRRKYGDVTCQECPEQTVISEKQSIITTELERTRSRLIDKPQCEKTSIQHYKYLEKLGFIERVPCRTKGIVEEKKICFTPKGIILYLWINHNQLRDSVEFKKFCELIKDTAKHIFLVFENNFVENINEIKNKLNKIPAKDYFIFLSYYLLDILENNNQIRVLTRYFPPYYSEYEKRLMKILHQKATIDRSGSLREFLNEKLVLFQWYSVLSEHKDSLLEVAKFLTTIDMNKSREIINFIIDPKKNIEKMKKIPLKDLIARLNALYFMINYYSFQMYLEKSDTTELCGTMKDFLIKLDKVLTVMFTLTFDINREFEDMLQKMSFLFLNKEEVPLLREKKDTIIKKDIENQFAVLINYLSDNCLTDNRNLEYTWTHVLNKLLHVTLKNKNILDALCKELKEKKK